MGDWPSIPIDAAYEDGGASTGSKGTVITAAATINTKPSTFTTIVASTAMDADGFLLQITDDTNTSQDYLVDIAIGASTAEQIIAADLLVSRGSGTSGYVSISAYFPIPIPAGTRISARCQSTITVATLCLHFDLLKGGGFCPGSLGRVTAYGAVTEDSGGTSIDAGAVIDTKGAWIEVSPSIANPIKQMLVAVGSQANTTVTTNFKRFDIGIGANPNEVAIIENILLTHGGTSDLAIPNWTGPFPASIPAGTRLVARSQCSITDANDRLIDVVIYGID